MAAAAAAAVAPALALFEAASFVIFTLFVGLVILGITSNFLVLILIVIGLFVLILSFIGLVVFGVTSDFLVLILIVIGLFVLILSFVFFNTTGRNSLIILPLPIVILGVNISRYIAISASVPSRDLMMKWLVNPVGGKDGQTSGGSSLDIGGCPCAAFGACSLLVGCLMV